MSATKPLLKLPGLNLTLVVYPLVYPNEVQLLQVDDLFWETDFLMDPPRYGLFNTFLDAIDGSYCSYSAFGETGDSKKIDPIYPDLHNDTGSVDPYWKHPAQCGVFTPPGVITMSYSWDEAAYPKGYSMRQCNEFAKLGMLLLVMHNMADAKSADDLFSHARHDYCGLFG